MTKEALDFTDILTKKTYRVPQDHLKMFQIYRSRYAIGLSMIILFMQFDVSTPISIGSGVLYIGITEFRYRTHFLRQCTVLNHKQSEKKNMRTSTQLLNMVLYLVLSCALVFYTLSSPNITNPTILYSIAGASGGIALFYGYKYLSNSH